VTAARDLTGFGLLTPREHTLVTSLRGTPLAYLVACASVANALEVFGGLVYSHASGSASEETRGNGWHPEWRHTFGEM
jgi:hypothetical protein